MREKSWDVALCVFVLCLFVLSIIEKGPMDKTRLIVTALMNLALGIMIGAWTLGRFLHQGKAVGDNTVGGLKDGVLFWFIVLSLEEQIAKMRLLRSNRNRLVNFQFKSEFKPIAEAASIDKQVLVIKRKTDKGTITWFFARRLTTRNAAELLKDRSVLPTVSDSKVFIDPHSKEPYYTWPVSQGYDNPVVLVAEETGAVGAGTKKMEPVGC